MASLSSSQFHSPAEVLQTSQARKCHHAHRTKKKKILVWKFGTWNVRSMVDVEGPIEIASQNYTAWYDTALSRKTWYERYTAGLQQFQQVQHHHMQPTRDVLCVDCGRTFRRQCDKARHKCIGERQRPVCEQRGAVQCHNCSRWFRSMGGLKVHRCNTISSQLPTNSTSTRRQTRQQLSRDLRCEYCDRVFSRPGDKKRHKCLAERSKPVQEQAGSVVCSRCSKWFLSRGGLAVHKCGTVSTGHE